MAEVVVLMVNGDVAIAEFGNVVVESVVEITRLSPFAATGNALDLMIGVLPIIWTAGDCYMGRSCCDRISSNKEPIKMRLNNA